MLSPEREYFVKDGVVMEIWQFDPAWSKGRKTVYEVMRVINGIPLFLEEHVNRLLQSASKTGIRDIADPGRVSGSIRKLIQANRAKDGNILFCLINENGNVHILTWFVEHHYPSAEEYSSGVYIRSMKAVRKHPNAKTWNAELRKKASYLIASSDAYEVLLVDKKKNITEGSRSNIFFIRGNTIFTPPENKVLKGITRQKVLEICENAMVRINEKEIPLQEVPFYEAAFITGTSPGILPVNAIENHRFNNSNELMRKLMEAYQSIVGKASNTK